MDLSRTWKWQTTLPNDFPPPATVTHISRMEGGPLTASIVAPPGSAAVKVVFYSSLRGMQTDFRQFEIPTFTTGTAPDVLVPTQLFFKAYGIGGGQRTVSAFASVSTGAPDVTVTGYADSSVVRASTGNNKITHVSLTCKKNP